VTAFAQVLVLVLVLVLESEVLVLVLVLGTQVLVLVLVLVLGEKSLLTTLVHCNLVQQRRNYRRAVHSLRPLFAVPNEWGQRMFYCAFFLHNSNFLFSLLHSSMEFRHQNR